MPYYDGSMRLNPSISDSVDRPKYGETIDFGLEFEFDVYLEYIDKCIALGYVESGRYFRRHDESKPLSRKNYDFYESVLTGQGYEISAYYTNAGEGEMNWNGFYVKRIRER